MIKKPITLKLRAQNITLYGCETDRFVSAGSQSIFKYSVH